MTRFTHVIVFNRDGAQVGSVVRRPHGTHFHCLWHAKGRALELDGIGGRPREVIKRLEAEGFVITGYRGEDDE